MSRVLECERLLLLVCSYRSWSEGVFCSLGEGMLVIIYTLHVINFPMVNVLYSTYFNDKSRRIFLQ